MRVWTGIARRRIGAKRLTYEIGNVPLRPVKSWKCRDQSWNISFKRITLNRISGRSHRTDFVFISAPNNMPIDSRRNNMFYMYMYHVTQLVAFSYTSSTQCLRYACKQTFPFVTNELKLKSRSGPALLWTIKQCKSRMYKDGHQVYKEHGNVISCIISQNSVLEIQWFCNFHKSDWIVPDMQNSTEVLIWYLQHSAGGWTNLILH
jgi:hypothetical protein